MNNKLWILNKEQLREYEKERETKIENIRDFIIGKTDLLILEVRKQQHGGELVSRGIIREKGKLILTELNCYSSSDYDLGTCQCNSHSSWKDDEEINETKLMLEILRLLR